jgi:hypothetical protein
MYYQNRYRTRTLADPPGGRCPLVNNNKGVSASVLHTRAPYLIKIIKNKHHIIIVVSLCERHGGVEISVRCPWPEIQIRHLLAGAEIDSRKATLSEQKTNCTLLL